MADEKDKSKAIEFFLELVEKTGVAVSTVSDGHVLMFKRIWLEKLLESTPDNQQITIFIKRPDFKN